MIVKIQHITPGRASPSPPRGGTGWGLFSQNFLLKGIILAMLMMVFGVSAWSQEREAVSFIDVIKTLVADTGSVFFYPKLLQKVKDHPEALTETDVQYLYYGQVFNIGFTKRPFLSADQDILEQYMRSSRKKKVIEFGTEILKKYPVDLTTLLWVSTCLKDKRLPDTTYFFDKRYRLLLAAILGTGNGKSCETAIVVTDMTDEFILKGVLGYLGGTDGILPSKHKYGAVCVWDTPKGKIFFEEIYYSEEKK
ncbi:MAG: DUF4919 domain-containing protein [Bacteroidota bacterium]